MPCSSYQGTLVDRIYTRIGAQDHILANKSTFFIELEETNQILQQATEKSLVIVDELGRGTSTYDGYALAKAVLNFLVRKIQCLTMFTTHYRWLVDDYLDNPRISLHTMLIDKRDKDNGTGEKPTRAVVFLYKFAGGVAESSFGVGVAEMAGLPESVLRKAELKSLNFKMPGLN